MSIDTLLKNSSPKAAGMSVVKTLYNLDKSHHASASDYINEDKR